MSKFICVLLSTPFISLMVHAGDSANTLPTVVVKGKRLSQKSQFPRIKSLMDESYIPQRRIEEHQYQTVEQAVRVLPGVTVVQSGNEGQQTSLFIRGTESRHTQIRRDGMKLIAGDTYTGSYNFGLLRTSDVESIEVVRGPVTSLYGAGAPGGVVLLTTPLGTGETSKKLSLEGGSRYSYKARGILQGDVARTNFYGNLTQYGTRGYRQRPKEFYLPGGQYRSLPFEQTLGTFRLGQQINDSTYVSWINSLSRNRVHTQREKKITHMAEETYYQRLLFQNTQEFLESTWGMGYNQVHSDADLHELDAFRNTLSRFQADVREVWKINDSNCLAVSAEYGLEHIHTRYPRSTTSSPYKGHENQLGGGFFYRWTMAPFVLEASGRLDSFQGSKLYPTYRFSGQYEFFSGNWVVLSYGTAIKEPTLVQRHFRSPYNVPNPQLKPEEIETYEMSWRCFWTGDLKSEILYFHNNLSEIINYDYKNRTNTNDGKAVTKGVEAIITYEVSEKLSLEGNYTYTHAKNIKTNRWLLRRPFNKWSFLVTYKGTDYTVCVDLNYVGKQQDRDFISSKSQSGKAYAQLDLKGDYKLNEQTKVYGRLENCLNSHTQNPVGFRRAGMTIMTGLEIVL